MSSAVFVYKDISSNVPSSISDLPLVNTQNTFTTSNTTITTTDNGDGTSTITVTFTDPSNNIARYNGDGISFNGFDSTNVEIISFDNGSFKFPLANNGYQFKSFQGSIASDAGSPLIGSNLSFCFRDATTFNSDISSWDTSNVRNMSFMFFNASAFDQPLNQWDTSNVTNMQSIFYNALAFDQPLNQWDTSKVQNMGFMFYGTTNFKQTSIRYWTVDSETSFTNMFGNATAFLGALDSDIKTQYIPDNKTPLYTFFNYIAVFVYKDISSNVPSSIDDLPLVNTQNTFTTSNTTITTTDNGDGDGTYTITVTFTGPSNNIEYYNGDGISFYGFDSSNVEIISFDTGFYRFPLANNSNQFNSFKGTIASDAGSPLIGSNLSSCFRFASGFNSDISSWDTSKVTNMGYMFYGAEAFNQPLNNWDTSNVTNMSFMFFNAKAFDKNIDTNGNNWNTSKVQNMSGMFEGASAFNQPLNNWNTSEVTNMAYMFNNATAFNQDISSWNTSKVIDMGYMFYYATNFKQTSIRSWTVGSSTTLSSMFDGATAFLGALDDDIKEQYISDNQTPSYTFFNYRDAVFVYKDTEMATFGTLPLYKNSDIDKSIINNDTTNISNIDNGDGTYTITVTITDVSNNIEYYNGEGISTYNRDLPQLSKNNIHFISFDTGFYRFPLANPQGDGNQFKSFQGTIASDAGSPLIGSNLSFCFSNATNFNSDISSWKTDKVTNMYAMFNNNKINNTTKFNQPLNNWNTSNVTNMGYMFYGAEAFNQPLNNWNTSEVTNMSYMFFDAKAFDKNIDTNGNNWNTSKVKDMSFMFYGAEAFNQPLNNWNTSEVTNMGSMFQGAKKFNQPLNNWVTSNVQNMGYMFNNADAFNKPLNNWITNDVKDMSAMFANAIAFNEPLNNWNTSEVTAMGSMFEGATAFNQNIDTSGNNWVTNKVKNMSYMFYNATNFNEPLNNWNTSEVTAMARMFSGATVFDKPLNNWDTSSVTDMSSMFNGATNFKQTSIRSWTVNQGTSLERMFSGATAFLGALEDDIKNEKMNFSVDTVRNVTHVTPSYTFFNYIAVFVYKDTNVPSSIDDLPLVNTQNTFTTSNTDISSNANFDGTSTITVTFTDPSNNIARYNGDGISFNGFDSSNVHIISFDNGFLKFPLADPHGQFVQGNQFSSFQGTIASNAGSPLIGDNLSYCFSTADTFNSDISSWDTRNVTTMSGMFAGATAFNQNIDTSGNNWNTINVRNMSGMFSVASSFNQPLNNWDTTNVTDMASMFLLATSFNQDISSWNTTNVTNMVSMFDTASTFNKTSIRSWTVNQGTLLQSMFSGATAFLGALDDDIKEQFIPDNKTPSYTFFNFVNTAAVFVYKDISSNVPSSIDDLPLLNTENTFTTFNTTITTTGNGDGTSTITVTFNDPSNNIARYNGDGISFNGFDSSNVEIILFDSGTYRFPLANPQEILPGNQFRSFQGSIASNAGSPLIGDNLSSCFRDATTFNSDISSWDTSNVTNMGSMFEGATAFDQPLNNWVTSEVTNMNSMFKGATAFDQPLNNWVTSNVIDMSSMFKGATAFNQDISSWDTSNVIGMSYMFEGATAFNQNIDTSGNNWNTSKVKDMSAMFANAIAFNEPLNNWNTREVTAMTRMFYNADAFDKPLNNWVTSKVENMSSMFEGATVFNQNIDTSGNNWDTMIVTNMSSMFKGATAFDQDISNWNTINVRNMSSMFEGATAFDQDISSWVTSGVTDMSSMFNGATNFKQTSIRYWTVNQETSLERMFSGATAFLGALEDDIKNEKMIFSVDNVTNVTHVTPSYTFFNFVDSAVFIYKDANVPSSISDLPLVNTQNTFTTSNTTITTTDNVDGTSTITVTFTDPSNNIARYNGDGISFNGFDSSNVHIISFDSGTYRFPLANPQETSITRGNQFRSFKGTIASDAGSPLIGSNLSSCFINATTFNSDISSWDTSNVTTMYNMFWKAETFNQPLNQWKTTNVENMFYMFSGAKAFDQPLNKWDTRNVTTMHNMFGSAEAFDQDISSWNTSNVRDMSYMFYGAESFNQNIDTSGNNWDTSEVTSMANMFYGAKAFDQDISSWNTSNVTNMSHMFRTSAFNQQSIRSWTVGSSTNLTHMFSDDSEFIKALDDDIKDEKMVFHDSIGRVTPLYTFFNLVYEATFVYKDTNVPSSISDLPLVNTQNTFTTSNTTITTIDNGDGTSTITVTFTDPSNNIARYNGDGISFNGFVSTNVEIISFDNGSFKFPLANPEGISGSQFNLFQGIIASDAGSPLIGSNLRGCFENATNNYNINISSWNTRNVTDMSSMFSGANGFNSDISSWNTSNVEDMSYMFSGATSFNSDISSWDTSNVTDMSSMFSGANGFYSDISSWDTSKVTNMANMFKNASNFDIIEIRTWIVKENTNLFGMFSGATKFLYILDSNIITKYIPDNETPLYTFFNKKYPRFVIAF